MHIKEFLQKTDGLVEKMSDVQLRHCLYEIARKTEDDLREEFLQLLEDGLIGFDSNENKLPRLMPEDKVMEKIYYFEEAFRSLEEGELRFSAQEYETYNEYHWDSDWEVSYSDPEGIGTIIKDAYTFACECVNDLRYKQALFIFDLVLDVCTDAHSDESGEFYDIGLQEMMDEDLVSIDINKMVVYILYATYQSTRKYQRPEKIFEYFSYTHFKDAHIEDILSVGREEVKDFDAFIQSWIKFLMDETGDVATRLLQEAIANYKGCEGLIEIARETKGLRPSLYLESINELEKSLDYEKIMKIGSEAVEIINPDLKIRSKIAFKTSQASFFAGNLGLMNKCLYVTFESHTDIPNYLRLFANEKIAGDYKEKASKKIKKLDYPVNDFPVASCLEDEKNTLGENTFKILQFFNGDFEQTKKWCDDGNISLGWSSEFVWYGVRLMLLLLYNGQTPTKAIEKISSDLSEYMGFSDPESLLFLSDGIVLEKDADTKNGQDMFWNIFNEWKKYLPKDNMPVDEYISWLQGVIDRRICAIIKGKYRHKYEDTVILISAIGEIRESRGEQLFKSILIDAYHKKFPRHNAFRAKLREYS